MNIQTFRKKPVEIEAMQVTSSNVKEVANWVNGRPDAWHEGYDGNAYPDIGGVEIPTLDGTKYVRWGHWVVKDATGQFAPYSPDLFETIFEAVRPGGEPA